MATHYDGRKVGRNERCPCGSGQKFKRCHGALDEGNVASTPIAIGIPQTDGIPEAVRVDLERMRARHEAAEYQRQLQQGRGRPIISTVFNDKRVVAVGKGLHWSAEWKTFHDFLFYYIKKTLGADGWGTAEIKKPFEDRHPLIQWYDYLCLYQRQFIKTPGEVHHANMTGAVHAYLGLAYYLYLIAHNARDISTRLIKRLKDPNNFRGAYYETYVASLFINAGFELEFEDEGDRTRSHCEFTATFPLTGRKFSVEAKARQPAVAGNGGDPARANAALRLGRPLFGALKKQANHERVIFVDINIPDRTTEAQRADWMDHAVASLRQLERTKFGVAADKAYVFVTNHPYTYNLEGTEFRTGVLADSFKIPESRAGARLPSIGAALEARERHREIFELLESIKSHRQIPATFAGENPELEFAQDKPPQLLVGQKYLVPNGDGTELPGELVDAVVMERDRVAVGIYRLDTGRQVLATCPLTETELRAYQQHPDTFFGVKKPAKREAKDALALYDFFCESYRHTPKDRLLEFMQGARDIDALRQLSQEELAKVYCERCTYSAVAKAEADKQSEA